MKQVDLLATGEVFAEFIDWRTEHPSDDIMTDLLNAEFEDETGTRARLTPRRTADVPHRGRDGAGNETTTRLIGWAGKTLAEHPDQRRELAENPALIPQAIEELLRCEPPAPQIARYVTRDVEYYGQTVPAGQRDADAGRRRQPRPSPVPADGDVFDIHRELRSHMTFGVGTHFCLGMRWPAWRAGSRWRRSSSGSPNGMSTGPTRARPRRSTVRGWESMPTFVS